MEVKESGLFAAAEPIPQLGRHPEINEIIFSLRLKEVSPVLGVGDDQVVAQLLEIQDSRLKEFAEAQEKVQEGWITEQSEVLSRKQAQEWLETARQQGPSQQAEDQQDRPVHRHRTTTYIWKSERHGHNRFLSHA